MTLGQRIQEQRKAMGLSQEDLGEKLGVSRQAISKWEADGAVPEVDKLIALSKLFGITIGILLGLEEPTTKEPKIKQQGGPTTQELAVAEALVAQYAAPRRRWPGVVLALVGVLAMGAAFFWMNQLSQELEQLKISSQNNMLILGSQLSGQISQEINQRWSDQADSASGDFFSAQTCEVETVDADAGTATLRLSVTPKRYVEGMTAQFTITGQEFATITTPPQSAEGQTFAALVTLPLDNNITVTAAIQEGNTTETRPLGNFLDLKKESGITLEVAWDSAPQTVAVSTAVGAYSTATPAESSLRVKKDGKILYETGLILPGEVWGEVIDPDGQTPGQAQTLGAVTFYIPVERWPEGEIEAYLKDTAGREYVVPLKEN